VLVDKLTPRLRAFAIRRGDIVVADSSYKSSYTVCKRVVALEGDTVVPAGGGGGSGGGGSGGGGGGGGIDNGGLDGSGDDSGDGGTRIVVPRGHVWLEGDNAQDSTDSRAYGPVPTALVRGRVFARVWPLGAATIFDARTPRPAANYARLSELLADAEISADAQRRAAARAAAAAAAREAAAAAAADKAAAAAAREERALADALAAALVLRAPPGARGGELK